MLSISCLNFYSLEMLLFKSLNFCFIVKLLVTSFVYEFFIFNYLYQIDWSTTLNSNEIQYHDRDFGELKQKVTFKNNKKYI